MPGPLCVNPTHHDPHGLSDACTITAADLEAVSVAVGAVLFNVSNFPERVQTRLLGQDMAPLRERLTAAVLDAGLRLPASSAAIRDALAVLTSHEPGEEDRLERIYRASNILRAALEVSDRIV